jgi:hypothetical protein
MARPLQLEFAGTFFTSRPAPIVGKPVTKPTLTDRLLDQVCESYYWLCHAYFQMGQLSRLVTCNLSLSLTAGAVLGVEVQERVSSVQSAIFRANSRIF